MWDDVSTSAGESDSGDNSSHDEVVLARGRIDNLVDHGQAVSKDVGSHCHPHPDVSEEEYDHAIDELGRHVGTEKVIAYGHEMSSFKLEFVVAKHGEECGPKDGAPRQQGKRSTGGIQGKQSCWPSLEPRVHLTIHHAV